MNKLEEKIALYKEKMKEIEPNFDEELLEKITRSLGPSIYKKDSEIVSCSSESELERVRKNFLKMKLGLDKSDEELDKAIKEVCEKMGSSNRNKYRALFYYFLVKKFNKESLYI
ncbi:DUF2853 family protein [Nitratiruptor tergarcus]|uniref:DUF2853 domain-containing protein n=1 Tax=Nitratiruptor tergarcus DSM 16512 TaxID=1069081 RepID=A0A1W1WTH0_9BACT|nr:DUF2853 family protein [Nitratiruptor tergarcus]SMC09043.1 Protein of unknown function [Nitratiruptor tergarcus DSM 16512]